MATVADIKKWVESGETAKRYQRIIALEIAMNARGVYDFLKANRLLGANWTKGYETTRSSRQKMAELLKAAADKSGNPMAFAQMLAASTPDVDLTRDMVAQNVVRTLLSSHI